MWAVEGADDNSKEVIMKDLHDILTCLEKSPAILANLAASIPGAERKRRRLDNAWTVHEHVCHLVQVQPMLISRCRMFRDEEHPVIRPFLPGKSDPEDDLMAMDWDSAVADFPSLRGEMFEVIESFDDAVWKREASHPEYRNYTPYIFVRHVLMHDHWHMYRIEELWLTTDEYLTA
jgi:hypothetical protein